MTIIEQAREPRAIDAAPAAVAPEQHVSNEEAERHQLTRNGVIAFTNSMFTVAFRAGLLACREYMARFVDAQDKGIAQSIRANWWPSLGGDPGPPRLNDWSEWYEGEYPDGRCITPDASVEALPYALQFLQRLGYEEAAARIESDAARIRELEAPQGDQPERADILKSLRSPFNACMFRGDCIARIESDAARIRELEQRVGEAENRIETDDKLLATAHKHEAKLREALRLRTVQPVWASNLATRIGKLCLLCGAESRQHDAEPPHAPGCLAAPDSAAEQESAP